MGRSMACELAQKGIRVNTLSPGYIYTKCVRIAVLTCCADRCLPCRLTGLFVDSQPGLLEKWSSQNPSGRLGRPDELRGVVTWLASDASTYCNGSEYVKSPDLVPKMLKCFISIIVDGGHRAW